MADIHFGTKVSENEQHIRLVMLHQSRISNQASPELMIFYAVISSIKPFNHLIFFARVHELNENQLLAISPL